VELGLGPAAAAAAEDAPVAAVERGALQRGEARAEAAALLELARFQTLAAGRASNGLGSASLAHKRLGEMSHDQLMGDVLSAILRFAASQAAHRKAAATAGAGGGGGGEGILGFLEVESTGHLAPRELGSLLSMASAQLRQGRDVLYLFRVALPRCMRSTEGWDADHSTAVRDALLRLWQVAVATRCNIMKLHAALVASVLPKLAHAAEAERGPALCSLLHVVTAAMADGTRDAAVLLSEATSVAWALQKDQRRLGDALKELIGLGDEWAARGGEWQLCMLSVQDSLEFATARLAEEEGGEAVALSAFRALLRAKGSLGALRQMTSVCKPHLLEHAELLPLWRRLFALLAAADVGAFSRLVPLLLALASLRERPATRPLHDLHQARAPREAGPIAHRGCTR
jgi:hypothetical protein